MICRSLEFTIPGPVDTIVLVEEVVALDGSIDLRFTVAVDESGGVEADLRGLFWDVADESKLPGLSVVAGESPDVTDSQFGADDVTDLGNGANMKGSITKKGAGFDAGVEFGTQGIGKDDIDATSFTLSGADGVDLSLDDIGGMRFGVRLTSVGEDGSRDDSLKLAAEAPHAPDAVDDDYSHEEDTILTGNVLDNDGDADGDPLTVTEVNGSAADIGSEIAIAGGWLTLNADGSFSFTPETGFVGEASFEYKVSDGAGGTDCAEATIEVTEVTGIVASLGDGLAIAPASLTLDDDDGGISNVTRGLDGTVTFTLNVAVPDLPEKADIVLAQDLSGSFEDDLPVLKAGNFVADLLADLTLAGAEDVGFGIASFVDYPISPFGNSGDFVYTTNQGVTTNAAVADAALDLLSASGGNDIPEAQLVALQQVAARAAGEIGFRADAQRFVVLSTDATFHVASNYPGGGPNDNDADLGDGLGVGGLEDYPAVAQVAALLAAAEITPIFTVTTPLVGVYQNLLNQMNALQPGLGGSVQTLASDSSNLAAAISAGLAESTTDVDIFVSSDDYGFVQSVTPASYANVPGPSTVSFDVELSAPGSYGDDQITLTVPGFGEVTLNLSFGIELLSGTVGRDELTGNGAANLIEGGARSDKLWGEGGNDILVGGLGKDKMWGGEGDDVFVIEDAPEFRGKDCIKDFVLDEDVVELSGFGIGFGDLVLVDSGAGHAQVFVADGKHDDPVAVLKNIASADLDAGDFIFS
ncbi:Ig-like domain-containing protein [Albimonas sp. CAU 1670]|uniref:Ig-like domain-containing protein n=1 Tax=Albimonas sp. CAU 1670 TaxID=3032599 RepID=UPI0023DA45CF|nr:Ig-like domain-containing protein [Albimonas sp. CAU 1670]MDF2235866.1 Ig-like domain-containing protein [Albimonas sp. CAU 1670]